MAGLLVAREHISWLCAFTNLFVQPLHSLPRPTVLYFLVSTGALGLEREEHHLHSPYGWETFTLIAKRPLKPSVWYYVDIVMAVL